MHMVLSSRMPELRALEVLLAVARSGSLNAAARELGVTQQAVSARITSIEAQTGVPLIVRSTHGSALERRAREEAEEAQTLDGGEPGGCSRHAVVVKYAEMADQVLQGPGRPLHCSPGLRGQASTRP
jgi:predicted transcriptional regulator